MYYNIIIAFLILLGGKNGFIETDGR